MMEAHQIINLLLEGTAHVLLMMSGLLVFLRVRTRGTMLILFSTLGMGIGFCLRHYVIFGEMIDIKIHKQSLVTLLIEDFGLLIEASCMVFFAIGLFHFSTLFRQAVAGERRFGRHWK